MGKSRLAMVLIFLGFVACGSGDNEPKISSKESKSLLTGCSYAGQVLRTEALRSIRDRQNGPLGNLEHYCLADKSRLNAHSDYIPTLESCADFFNLSDDFRWDFICLQPDQYPGAPSLLKICNKFWWEWCLSTAQYEDPYSNILQSKTPSVLYVNTINYEHDFNKLYFISYSPYNIVNAGPPNFGYAVSYEGDDGPWSYLLSRAAPPNPDYEEVFYFIEY